MIIYKLHNYETSEPFNSNASPWRQTFPKIRGHITGRGHLSWMALIFNIDFNFTSLEILVKNFSRFRLIFQKCKSSVFQLSEEFTKFTCVSCPRCLELDFLNCANERAGVWNFKPFEIQSGNLYKLFDPVFGVAQVT